MTPGQFWQLVLAVAIGMTVHGLMETLGKLIYIVTIGR